eukprot:scaffold4079_cov392-Prasinococcus_capsulatus_cf.AAC.7
MSRAGRAQLEPMHRIGSKADIAGKPEAEDCLCRALLSQACPVASWTLAGCLCVGQLEVRRRFSSYVACEWVLLAD